MLREYSGSVRSFRSIVCRPRTRNIGQCQTADLHARVGHMFLWGKQMHRNRRIEVPSGKLLGRTGAVALWALVGLMAVGSSARATTVDFETLVHGKVVTDQFLASHGLTISAVNPNRSHDLAIIFDSMENGTSDPDLEGPPWAGGNLPSDTVLGNMLIIAEKGTQSIPGIVDDPNDEGHRPAGDLIFDFTDPMTSFGFDIVDVESVTLENAFITFYLNSLQVGQVQLSDLSNTRSISLDPTIQFGNNSANRIQPITAGDLGASGFDRVVFSMGGSGAVDNVTFVPEPGSLALIALAGVVVCRRRRRAC